MIFFSFKRRGPKRIEPWRGCWAWAQNLGGIIRPVVAIGLEWRSGLLLATPRCTGIALPGALAIDFFRYRPTGHRSHPVATGHQPLDTTLPSHRPTGSGHLPADPPAATTKLVNPALALSLLESGIAVPARPPRPGNTNKNVDERSTCDFDFWPRRTGEMGKNLAEQLRVREGHASCTVGEKEQEKEKEREREKELERERERETDSSPA